MMRTDPGTDRGGKESVNGEAPSVTYGNDPRKGQKRREENHRARSLS